MQASNNTVHVVSTDEAFGPPLVRLLGASGFRPSLRTTTFELFATREKGARGCLIADLGDQSMEHLRLHQLILPGELKLQVIVVSASGHIPTVVRFVQAGALDFFVKPFALEKLLPVVRRAFEIVSLCGRSSCEVVGLQQRLSCLTPRQLEVMQYVVRGLPNKHIAMNLGRSERTVKVHRREVMRRMGVQSAAELAGLVTRLCCTQQLPEMHPSRPVLRPQPSLALGMGDQGGTDSALTPIA